jgi:aldose 1-epimerase
MLELRAGPEAVVIDPARGARVVSLVAGGVERILGAAPDSRPEQTTWGCFLMAPWVGRIEGGTFAWAGRTCELRRNLGNHAIHGVVFDEMWAVEEHWDRTAVLRSEFDPTRWPLGGGVVQRMELSEGRLSFEATVHSGGNAMPASVGWHPWFRRPQTGGDMRVRVSSARVLETTTELIPTGQTVRARADLDLNYGPLLADRRLDTAYVRARSPAVVAWPDLELNVGFGDPISTVVVYTPAEGVCVEPQTAWPNAPRLAAEGHADTGIVRLPPGGELVATTTWTWRAT